MAAEKQTSPYKLPKGTLAKVMLAHAFAEYDPILQKQGVFVETPAARAAEDPEHGKCIIVGRRGSGKTAINLHLSAKRERTSIQLNPKCLTSLRQGITVGAYADTRQRPFHVLVAVFKHALVLEAVSRWVSLGALSRHDLTDTLVRDKNRIEQLDFDTRVLDVFEELEPTLGPGQDKHYLKANRRLSTLLGEVKDLPNIHRFPITVIIDKVDDDWDGSDESVVVLMALMHACVELTAVLKPVRPLLFLRENLFERVRKIDNEFSRLETIPFNWRS